MRQLTFDELLALRLAFQDAFPTKAKLEMLFDQDLPGRTLDANAMGNDLTEVIRNLIGKAQKQGWLMRLLDAAVKSTNNPKLEDAARLLKPLRDLEEEDHFNVCFLSANSVMVNRTELRDALKELESAKPRGIRVLTVNGDPVSGKTYSKELISYLYEVRGNFEPIWIELGEYQNTGITAVDLAGEIIAKMGLGDETLPKDNREQPARWVLAFRSSLVGKMRGHPTNWWIVIDGFNQVAIPPEVDYLIQALARITQDLPRFRLILLGYPNELPDIARYAIAENIKPVEREDLLDFFIRLYDQIAQPFDGNKAAEKVAEILRNVDPNDPRRIETLGNETARVAKSIAT